MRILRSRTLPLLLVERQDVHTHKAKETEMSWSNKAK